MRTTIAAITVLVLVGLAALAGENGAGAAPGLPAFPGAEGFGAVARGGRGGKVIKVTNLNADGPGSLAAACAEKGPRIVVFEVSGVIPTKKGVLSIPESDITIAGQTAPGAGITVAGELSTKHPFYDRIFAAEQKGQGIEELRGREMIIRFMRFRPAERGQGHSVSLAGVERFILDHVSGSWGCDENMDFSTSRQFTVQWCGVESSGWSGPLEQYRIGDSSQFKAGGNNPHNYGMIMGYTDKGNVSLHHNFFAHHNRRTPLCGLEVLDERNNVIYNVAAGILFHGGNKNRDRKGEIFRANIVGNYFKIGPSTPAEHKDALPENKAGGYRCFMVGEAGAEIHADGNHFVPPGKTADVWNGPVRGVAVNKCKKAEKPWPAPPVVTQKAEEAYELVLAQAGCLPRDAVTKSNVKDIREGTGMWGRFEPKGGLLEGLTPGKAPADGDSDGLPDDWETAHKLNPADPKDAGALVPAGASRDDRHQGYTYIEYYINELADRLVEAARAEAAPAAGGK